MSDYEDSIKRYHDALRELVTTFRDSELGCDVEEQAARIFSRMSSSTDEDTCQLVGQFVLDVLRQQRMSDAEMRP